MPFKRPPKSGTLLNLSPLPSGPVVISRALECFYCGGQVIYAKATIDHIYPRSRTHYELADCADNLVVACSSCNFSKGTRTWDEWWTVLLDKVYPDNYPAENQDPREVAIIERADIIAAIIDFRNLEHFKPQPGFAGNDTGQR